MFQRSYKSGKKKYFSFTRELLNILQKIIVLDLLIRFFYDVKESGIKKYQEKANCYVRKLITVKNNIYIKFKYSDKAAFTL